MTRKEALAWLKNFPEPKPCRFCERVVLAGACCAEASRQSIAIQADKDAYWLWELDHRIWEQREHTDPRWNRRFWYHETGMVPTDDIERVIALAPKYIVEPHNACMGFNFGITIYTLENADVPDVVSEREIEDFAKAMGTTVPISKRIFLLTLTGAHLSTKFAETWKRLSPLSHNKKNEVKLKKYGFESLREKSYYDY